MATQRNYRKFTAQQKLEIVLAGLRGDRSVKDVCRDHEIAETLYYSWRDKLLEGGRRPPAACDETKVSAAARRGDTRNAARDIVRKRREHSCFARRATPPVTGPSSSSPETATWRHANAPQRDHVEAVGRAGRET